MRRREMPSCIVIVSEGSSGVFSLGQFECSVKDSITPQASSAFTAYICAWRGRAGYRIADVCPAACGKNVATPWWCLGLSQRRGSDRTSRPCVAKQLGSCIITVCEQ